MRGQVEWPDTASRWTAGDRAGLADLESKVMRDWSDLAKDDRYDPYL